MLLRAGSLPIQDAICLIDKGQLRQLKSQCGGLQTLLRNHGHIFQGSFEIPCLLPLRSLLLLLYQDAKLL